MPAARDPDLAVARITAEVERRASRACPGELVLAQRTLERLTPQRWVLEWHLPWWVGLAFDLPPDRAETLVTGNVLGLLALRLEDAVRDAELPAADIPAAARLSAEILNEAIAVYRTELPATSPFWPFLDGALRTWRHAQAPRIPNPRTPLAERAAPVRAPAFAVCLLTGQSSSWPLLQRCLDHALDALVRYDQLVDWEDDLAAGRWNAFVAGLARGPQDRVHYERNLAAVHVALLTTDVAVAEHGRVEADARAAAGLAAELGIRPLAAFLEDYAARTADQGVAVQRHYQEVADRAVQHMFGSRARA